MKDGSVNVMIVQTRCPQLTKSYFSTKAILQFKTDEEFLSFLLETAKPVISYVKNRKTSHNVTESVVNGVSNGLNGHISSDTESISTNGDRYEADDLRYHLNKKRKCAENPSDTHTALPHTGCEAEESLRQQKSGEDLSSVSASETQGNDRLVQHAGCEVEQSLKQQKSGGNLSYVSTSDTQGNDRLVQRVGNSTEQNHVQQTSTCSQTTLSIPSSPLRTPLQYRELQRSPWKRKPSSDNNNRSVKRARVIEVVVKNEMEATDDDARYFPVDLSCGRCPNVSSENSSIQNHGELLTTKENVGLKSRRMNAKKRTPCKRVDSALKSESHGKQTYAFGNDFTAPQLLKEYCCIICDRQFADATVLDRHMSSHIRTGNMSANTKSENNADHTDNAQSQIKGKELVKDQKRNPLSAGVAHPSTRLFECPCCSYSDLNMSSLWCHLKNSCALEKTRNLPCCFCPKKIESVEKLFQHIEQSHCYKDCNKCKDRISQIESSIHFKSHMKDKDPTKCYACDFTHHMKHIVASHASKNHFTTTSEVDMSTRMTDNGGYFCPSCLWSPQYGSFKALKAHYKSVHIKNRPSGPTTVKREGISNVADDEQEQSSSSTHQTGSRIEPKKSVSQKVETAVQKKEFDCSGCEYSTTDMVKLWDHIQNSCSWKKDPTTCCFCNYRVESQTILKKHIKHAHCLRKCDVCNEVFSRTDLSFHIRRHLVKATRSGFQCYACKETVTKLFHLMGHVSAYHQSETDIMDTTHRRNDKGRGYICMKCNGIFRTRGDIGRHYAKVHSTESYIAGNKDINGVSSSKVPKKPVSHPVKRKQVISPKITRNPKKPAPDIHRNIKPAKPVRGQVALDAGEKVASGSKVKKKKKKMKKSSAHIATSNPKTKGSNVKKVLTTKRVKKEPSKKIKVVSKKPLHRFHVTCKLCSKEYTNPSSLNSHIYQTHKMTKVTSNSMESKELNRLRAECRRGMQEAKQSERNRG